MSGNYAPIPIIDRMSAVLNNILESSDGMRATELLNKVAVPKTTLYRLLASMTENGFLTYFPETGIYSLGTKFMTSYVSVDERAGRLREAAMPYLRSLADTVHQTVKLTVISGLLSYTIASVESSSPLRISIDTGAVFPLHAGAAGKILMCCLDDNLIYRYYQLHGIRYTDKTIMEFDEIKRELELVRKRGYATDSGEYLPEIRAVAVPVLNSAGQIIASISVTYPSFVEERIDIEQLASQITQTANSVSEAFRTFRHKSRVPAKVVQE